MAEKKKIPNEIWLFNTLAGKKEEFKPLKSGEVKMYNCGPTVYNYAHIGNLRAYVFADVLRRTLEYNGYKVKQVMNITDVGHLASDADDGDDKMVKALKREGKPFTLSAMKEIADKYATAFVEDLKALNCELPAEMPRASEHIKEDIEIIKILLEKGVAYKTSNGIYFDISKYPEYGKLGQINLSGQLAGARVSVNSEKKNPADFSLWKFSKNEIGFDGKELGFGFPGWHIECSAMSRRYLGQPFDIHTGGIDHIPVHHNNEIAQSEAAFGVPLANYWMHNAHLNMGAEKMAKSGENFWTLKFLNEQGLSSPAYRYSLLTARYQTPMNFSPEAIPRAQFAFNSLINEFSKLRKTDGTINTNYDSKFLESINDNLNTSVALSVVWDVINDKEMPDADKRETLLKFDRVLGLDLEKESEIIDKKFVPSSELRNLLDERQIARAAKDFKKSDELRDEIKKLGFYVQDTDDGQVVEKT